MSCAGLPPPGTCRLSGRRLRLPCPWESGRAGLSPPSSLPPGSWLTPKAPSPEYVWPRARGSGRGRCPEEAELALTEAGGAEGLETGHCKCVGHRWGMEPATPWPQGGEWVSGNLPGRGPR